MISINGKKVDVDYYPDATQRINVDISSENAVVEWLYEKNEEMVLYFIAKHLKKQLGIKRVILHLPYIPHARMDRVKSKGEIFTLKYFAEFLNSMDFDKIIVRDAHSNVSTALIDHISLQPIENTVNELVDNLLDSQKDILFFPDEGSCKRYSDITDYPYAFGIKQRDWKTGNIEGLDVQGYIPKTTFDVLIIDDISSRGMTFLKSAERLKELGANKIYLYITHCENSILDGQLIKSDLIEKIYTTKSIFTKQHPLIEVIT